MAASGAPAASARIATVAETCFAIRLPATVGYRWSNEPAMTSETNPNRFSQAWAGLSVPHASLTGGQPATRRVASEAPTTTSAIALP